MVKEAYLENETVVEGGSSNFHCDVTSSSQPHITWLKRLDSQPDNNSQPDEDDVVIFDHFFEMLTPF